MILSPDSFIDESSMDLNEALEAAKMSFDASIILGDGFAVIFSEAEKGGRDRFLLSEKSIRRNIWFHLSSYNRYIIRLNK